MSNRRNLGVLAACLLAGAPMAKAGPDDAALLEQVKLLATKGQDAQTTAQVNQYVDQNQDAITAILKSYTDYLKQVQAMAADDGSGAPPTAQAASAPTAAPSPATAGQSTTSAAAAAGASQASTALNITGVQASGGLETAHLAGYPALPDVEPVSAITQPTAGQLEYAAKTQKEMQDRKAYLMANPQGYTY
jgi:hypothetical protein